jgi:thiol-disulfide isomerase/thioredoxin
MRIVQLFLLSILLTACGAKDTTSETSVSTSIAPVVSTEGPVSSITSGTDPLGSAKFDITVQNMADGPALLIGFVETEQFRVDSSSVRNQKVTFSKKEGYEQGFYFVFFPDRTSFQLLLGEDQEFSIKTTAGNFSNATTVEGSIDNELFYESLAYQVDLNSKVQSLSAEMQAAGEGSEQYETLLQERESLIDGREGYLASLYARAPESFFTSFKSAGQNPNINAIKEANPTLDDAAQVKVYRMQFWNNVNFEDKRLLRTPVIMNKLKRYMTELTVQLPDSITKSADQLIANVNDGNHPEYFMFFVNWIALNYQPTETTLMDSEAVMVHMVQNYFTEEKAFWAQPGEVQGLQQRASEMQASLVGKKGPDVVSTGPDGKSYSIYQMKEPYIVVYMYNPECEHCQEETPLLKAYHDKNKKKVGVFAIAIDTDPTKWNNYIKKVGMQDFKNVHDPTNRSIYAKYFVDKTPEMYVLNRDRVIIGKNLKTFQVEQLINSEEAKR